MKHRFPVLVLGCTVLLSTFGTAVTTEGADVTSTSAASVSVSSSSTDETTAPTKDLLQDVFIELGGEIADKTYDECLSYLNENGFSYETTEASETTLKSITVNDPDRDGYTLKLIFTANSAGEQTTSMVTYSNEYFKSCVTDGFHTDNVAYYFYDYTAVKPKKQVYSLYTLRDYFLNKVPEKTAELQQASSGEKLNVTMDAEMEQRELGVRFHVTTNLPEGTRLNLLLSKTLCGNTYQRSYTAVVKNGKAVTPTYFNSTKSSHVFGYADSDTLKNDTSESDEGISINDSEIADSDNSLSGNFTLTITTDLPKDQNDYVSSVMGVLGENLDGQYVVDDGISNGKTIQAVFKFNMQHE